MNWDLESAVIKFAKRLLRGTPEGGKAMIKRPHDAGFVHTFR
jgi:hypothetical protein